MPEIRAEDLTLTDLVGLGLDAVNDRLPTAILIEAARRYVTIEAAKRRRVAARRAEQQARTANPKVVRRIAQVSAEAAAETPVIWADILDVPIGAGGEGQTWGSATAEDHAFAALQAESSASGHVQRAAMHRRAVTDLERTGARTLADSTMGLR